MAELKRFSEVSLAMHQHVSKTKKQTEGYTQFFVGGGTPKFIITAGNHGKLLIITIKAFELTIEEKMAVSEWRQKKKIL